MTALCKSRSCRGRKHLYNSRRHSVGAPKAGAVGAHSTEKGGTCQCNKFQRCCQEKAEQRQCNNRFQKGKRKKRLCHDRCCLPCGDEKMMSVGRRWSIFIAMGSTGGPIKVAASRKCFRNHQIDIASAIRVQVFCVARRAVSRLGTTLGAGNKRSPFPAVLRNCFEK